MSASQELAATAAGNSVVSDGSAGSSAMRTPVAATGTTLFLRDENGSTFVPVFHQSSVTLRDLAEEFNISSVLECDAHGNVQPRAVAFDSPSDVLHSGRHYIARRDARAEMGSSYVTFKGKIFVKEYELEHPTPPAARLGKGVTIAATETVASSGSVPSRSKPATTPFPDRRRQQEPVSGAEHLLSPPPEESSTPGLQHMDDEEANTSISRALALSFERKRPRDESMVEQEESGPPGCALTDTVAFLDDARLVAEGASGDATADQGKLRQGSTVLQDRTNDGAAPNAALKAHSAAPPGGAEVGEATEARSSVAPRCQKQSLRFIPFSETASDGSETYVTLEDLQQLCQNLSSQEEEFQRKHRKATDILESARRVLFLNDGSE